MATIEISLDSLITKIARYEDMLIVLSSKFYECGIILELPTYNHSVQDIGKNHNVYIMDTSTGEVFKKQPFDTFIEAFRYALGEYTTRLVIGTDIADYIESGD